MAGYLDTYGAGEEQREKLIKTSALVLVAALVLGGVLYFFFKNYRQEHRVKLFFESLARQDYQGAYGMWGCTQASPCRDYSFNEFMKDWGPQSGKSAGHVVKSRSCGSGVILTVGYPGVQEDKLWVQRGDLIIGFSPWPGCPPGR
jgi:hypothetical protein